MQQLARLRAPALPDKLAHYLRVTIKELNSSYALLQRTIAVHQLIGAS